MRRRRTSPLGAALPAAGGPRLILPFVQPLTALTGLQEFLTNPCLCVIGVLLCKDQTEISKHSAHRRAGRSMLIQTPRQVVSDANVPASGITAQNVHCNHGWL